MVDQFSYFTWVKSEIGKKIPSYVYMYIFICISKVINTKTLLHAYWIQMRIYDKKHTMLEYYTNRTVLFTASMISNKTLGSYVFPVDNLSCTNAYVFADILSCSSCCHNSAFLYTSMNVVLFTMYAVTHSFFTCKTSWNIMNVCEWNKCFRFYFHYIAQIET